MNYTKRSSLSFKPQRDQSANVHSMHITSTNIKQSSIKTRNVQKINDNSFLNYKNLFPVQKEVNNKSSFKVFQMVDKKPSVIENKSNWSNTKNTIQVRNNSSKNIRKLNSKDNLNSSKEYTFIFSENNKKNELVNFNNNVNLSRVQSNNCLIDNDQFKYVKKVIYPARPINKFLNIKNENQLNKSQEIDVLSTDRTKLLEKEKKIERNKSFIETNKTKNRNISPLNMNYSKYISSSKNKKKTALDISSSSSFIEIPYSVHKNSSNYEDIFTFNSARMNNDETEEGSTKNMINNFEKIYNSSKLNNKRNKIIEENCLFCLSFSDHHNLTYSQQHEKKILNNSFKEKSKEKTSPKRKSESIKKKARNKSFSNGNSSFNQGRSNDVDTVEELHYVFVRFYQKNKDKSEENEMIRNTGNSVILLNELEIF